MTGAESSRKWRAENPEKAKAHSAKYRATNLEKVRKLNREYQAKLYAADPEACRLKMTKFRLTPAGYKLYIATNAARRGNR